MTGRDPLFNLIILVAAIIISRIIMEKALRPLSPDQKARLVDSFSGYRTWNLAAVLGLAVLYFAGLRYLPQWQAVTSLFFVIAFIVVTGIVSFLSWRKLKSLSLPDGYVKSYLISLGVQYVGIGFILAPMMADYV
jgi:hypothetical protein